MVRQPRRQPQPKLYSKWARGHYQIDKHTHTHICRTITMQLLLGEQESRDCPEFLWEIYDDYRCGAVKDITTNNQRSSSDPAGHVWSESTAIQAELRTFEEDFPFVVSLVSILYQPFFRHVTSRWNRVHRKQNRKIKKNQTSINKKKIIWRYCCYCSNN